MSAPASHHAREPRSGPPSASTPAPPPTSGLQPDPAPDRLAYSVNEAARITGLSRDLLYDQMRQGNLTYIKIGRRRLITRHHLEQFLDITSGTGPPGTTTPSSHKTGADAP
jgi:excisionase family DNA binding protein